LLKIVGEETDKLITHLEADLAELWAILYGHAETLFGKRDIRGGGLTFIEHILRGLFQVGQLLSQLKYDFLSFLPLLETEDLSGCGLCPSETQGLRREAKCLKEREE
jgi:hypothetical protein